MHCRRGGGKLRQSAMGVITQGDHHGTRSGHLPHQSVLHRSYGLSEPVCHPQAAPPRSLVLAKSSPWPCSPHGIRLGPNAPLGAMPSTTGVATSPRGHPRLLNRRTFNRRVRDLHGVLAAHLCHSLQLCVPYEVMDGFLVPVMARCRGNRHRCFANEVGIGCGGSDHDWYYGGQLVTIVNSHGFITGWTVGSAATEERWVADALLRWRAAPLAPPPTLRGRAQPLFGHDHPNRQRLGPTGPLGPALSAGHGCDAPLLADLGFTGVR